MEAGLTGARNWVVVAAVIVAAAVVPAAAPAAPGDQQLRASFTWSPERPAAGEQVTFTSTSTSSRPIASQRWDLDDDGEFDDGEGETVTWTFAQSGSARVRLRVEDAAEVNVAEHMVAVANRPPSASFTLSPENPVPGDTVTFTSTASDADGSIKSQAWDLDGDGDYDDAEGPVATRTFAAAGTYTVALLVVDNRNATGTWFVTFVVAPPPPPGSQAPSWLTPFPVVRIAGRTAVSGARIDVLSVRTAPRALVRVRCRGASCPWARKAYRTGRRGTLRIRRLERLLRARTVIELRITRPGVIGKYTRFRIRAGRAPARTERCLMPGAAKPSACPAS